MDFANELKKDVRCPKPCSALLLKVSLPVLSRIEIKCRRCGLITILRPESPNSERPERPIIGE